MLLNFDFDGVLVDSFDGLYDAVCHAHRETGAGRRPQPDDLRTCTDLTFEGLAEMLAIPEDLAGQFRNTAYQHMCRQDLPMPPLFEGIAEVIHTLASRHIITVITANTEASVRRCLESAGLNDVVTMVLDGNRPGAKSDKLAQNCRHFGVLPQQAVMVGDAVSDIREGKSAAVRTVAVTWGFQSEALLAGEMPDHLVHTPENLIDLFDTLA